MGEAWRATTVRRGLVVLAALAASVAVWLLFLRDGGDAGGGQRHEKSVGISPQVAELVGSLSREQQANQVLLLGFEGSDASAPGLSELAERELGGILVSAENWPGAAAAPTLLAELSGAGETADRIPPLAVAAHEGGPYRSFADLPPESSQLEIGDAGSVSEAERWASETAQALATAGFHLNLFPIADVATLHSPVADRAFSDDAAIVASLTGAALRGCRAHDLACGVAHFPGLGAASQDTDQGPATVSLDRASLAGRDLEPFRAAIAEQAPGVVLSVAFYAAYDPVTPAALTPEIATRLLRDQLGYEGMAITDDLSSGAIKAGYRVRDAAVAALAAGADLIQISLPADAAGVDEALVEAVEEGEVTAKRLAEAAGRVLELKRQLGLLRGPGGL